MWYIYRITNMVNGATKDLQGNALCYRDNRLGGTMIQQAWEVIAFVCVIITTLGGAGAIIVSIIKWWRQPDKTRDEMLKEHEKKLDNDHKRLMELEESNKIMMQSMLALMSHAIDGNHIEDLKQARDDLQKYLIRR